MYWSLQLSALCLLQLSPSCTRHCTALYLLANAPCITCTSIDCGHLLWATANVTSCAPGRGWVCGLGVWGLGRADVLYDDVPVDEANATYQAMDAAWLDRQHKGLAMLPYFRDKGNLGRNSNPPNSISTLARLFIIGGPACRIQNLKRSIRLLS